MQEVQIVRMLKKALKEYLERYFKMWKKVTGSFPKVIYEEDGFSSLCIGEEDEDGYIEWNYRSADTLIDFSKIEKKHSVVLHQEIKEYYNAYRFRQFAGIFENETIVFDPIDNIDDAILGLDSWLQNINREMIIIGHKKWDVPVYVKVHTGEVVVWKSEIGQQHLLAASLSELFDRLTVDETLIDFMY